MPTARHSVLVSLFFSAVLCYGSREATAESNSDSAEIIKFLVAGNEQSQKAISSVEYHVDASYNRNSPKKAITFSSADVIQEGNNILFNNTVLPVRRQIHNS